MPLFSREKQRGDDPIGGGGGRGEGGVGGGDGVKQRGE